MKRILDRRQNQPLKEGVQKEQQEKGKDIEKCPRCGNDLVNVEGKKICTHRTCLYTESD